MLFRNAFQYSSQFILLCKELTSQLCSIFFHREGLQSFSSIHPYIPFAALLGCPGLGHTGLTKCSKYCNRKVIHSQKFSSKSLSSSYKRLHFLMIKNHILKQHILREWFWQYLGSMDLGRSSLCCPILVSWSSFTAVINTELLLRNMICV